MEWQSVSCESKNISFIFWVLVSSELRMKYFNLLFVFGNLAFYINEVIPFRFTSPVRIAKYILKRNRTKLKSILSTSEHFFWYEAFEGRRIANVIYIRFLSSSPDPNCILHGIVQKGVHLNGSLFYCFYKMMRIFRLLLHFLTESRCTP